MSKRSQYLPDTEADLRRKALEQAALHMTMEGASATVPELLDRARAYLGFLDGGGVETVGVRAAMLDLARGIGDEADGDVIVRAARLLRYVEEGA